MSWWTFRIQKPEEENPEVSESVSQEEVPESPPKRVWQSYLIPLPGQKHLEIQGWFPMTQSEWDQFMRVLDAMTPGLVE